VEKIKDEVEEMEQYGGTAGSKDDEVEMISNPLVVQMKDMQRRLDASTRELAEEEAHKAKVDNDARREHIVSLNADRDNLAAELARLQRKFHSQAAAMPVSRPQIEQHQVVGPPALAPRPNTATQKQEFKATQPKRKDF
jgi:hypothetical protein